MYKSLQHGASSPFLKYLSLVLCGGLRCPAAHITKQWSAWIDSFGDPNSNYVNEQDFILRLNADSELSIFW